MTTSCGFRQHDEHCLCDVIVDTPAPIRFSPTDVLFADDVMKHKRLGTPWTRGKVCDLLEALAAATDAVAEVKACIDPNVDPEYVGTYSASIKRLIAKGYSMVDIPNLLGLSFVKTVQGLFAGRTTKLVVWNEADWLAFEADVLDGRGPDYLSRHHPFLAYSTAHKLVKVYRAGGKSSATATPERL